MVQTIAVTGAGGGVGQTIYQSLARSWMDARVIGYDTGPLSVGLHWSHRARLIPSASDPRYTEVVRAFAAEDGVNLLIPGSDPELPVLAAARPTLEADGTRVVVGSAESVGICRDKLRTYQFFASLGLPFVRTVLAEDAETLAEEAGFPIVLKPAGGSASVGTRVVFDRAGLREYAHVNGLIAQAYLVPASWEKPPNSVTPRDVFSGGRLRQTDECMVQVLTDVSGNHLGTFMSRNTLRDGVVVAMEPFQDDSIAALAKRMTDALLARGHVGPLNLQARITDRGPVFYELNPRFAGGSAARAALGFNEVDAVVRRTLFDEPLDEVRRRLQPRTDAACIRYMTDLVVPAADLAALQAGPLEGKGPWSGEVT